MDANPEKNRQPSWLEIILIVVLGFIGIFAVTFVAVLINEELGLRKYR